MKTILLISISTFFGSNAIAVPLENADVYFRNFTRRGEEVVRSEAHMPGIEIQVGVPPQKLRALLDTGSSDFVLPFASCEECAGLKLQDGSSTWRWGTDTCSLRYSGGDIVSGLPAQDTVTFNVQGQGAAFSLPGQGFLAVDKYDAVEWQEGRKRLSPGGFDGIIGLAPTPNMHCGGRSFFQNFAPQIQGPKLVAFHLTADPHRKSSVTFGKTDPTLYSGELQFHDVSRGGTLADPDAWVLQAALWVNGAPFQAKVKILLDTGAAFIYGHPRIVKAFYAHIDGAIPVNGGTTGYVVPCSLPPDIMAFRFGGARYNVAPKYFAAEPVIEHDGYCWGAFIGLEELSEDVVIVGGPLLKTWYSVFDFERFKIGLARAV